MRLLNTSTLALTEFLGDAVPEYAILSHTWVSDQEISLQDLEAIHKHSTSLGPHPDARKSGYKKIEQCCHKARLEGFDWVWIDTCCINKNSSAELSEAINSMFHWYRESRVCYALLSDVSGNTDLSDTVSELRACRWLTRGWTLQEMLAPRELIFFNKEWTSLGTRDELSSLLSEFTKVPSEYLHSNHQRPLPEASIAQRMSWAAARSTTRIEDTAYCLLGIFDVNMPLLYGEGKKAFIRLQEEIIRRTEDQTIFTWGYKYSAGYNRSSSTHVPPEKIPSYHPEHAYLAQSPSEFAHCSNVVIDNWWRRSSNRDFEITKKGLRVTLPLILKPKGYGISAEHPYAVLDCSESEDLLHRIVIPLSQPRGRTGELHFTLTGPPRIMRKQFLRSPDFKTFYINFPVKADDKSSRAHGSAGGILVPKSHLFTIEQLASDNGIHVETYGGASSFVLRRKSRHDRQYAPERVYFRF